jgi:hypothetical protein
MAGRMRSVRCDLCGTKALTAASQCPKCGHLFKVRDGFGALLPLAYCSTCDSYYPESVGSCRWCGTQPERAPIAPYVWRCVGVAALVVVAAGAWLMRDARPKHTSQARVTAPVTSDSIAISADTHSVSTAMASTDSVRSPENATVVSSDTMAPTVASRAEASAQPPEAQPKQAPAVASTAPPPSPSSPAGWVSFTAKGWVIVRAEASKSSRIVASIGPNSRVQLGESRGEWRRIRARGIVGWVQPASYFTAMRTSRRVTTAHGLAAR